MEEIRQSEEIRPGKDPRTIGDLLAELSQETALLVQQEIQLARAELSEKVSQVERGAVSLGVGAMICYAGFLALLAAAIFGLALVVDLWLAALIVGVVTALVGFAVLAKGREDLKAKNMNLPRTRETLQEDKQWIKAQMR